MVKFRMVSHQMHTLEVDYDFAIINDVLSYRGWDDTVCDFTPWTPVFPLN